MGLFLFPQIFLPERDLVAGTIEHSASVDIITERCGRALTLFSPSFLDSPTNKLYTDLAQYLGVQRRSAFIIPIMLKYCEYERIFLLRIYTVFWTKLSSLFSRRNLPASLNMLSKLSYDHSKRRFVNFYAKLFKTFGVFDAPPELLEYPDEFAGFSSRPPPYTAHAAPLPAPANQVIEDVLQETTRPLFLEGKMFCKKTLRL